MTTPHPVYRSLLRLYPREFRVHYGDELVQTFADLVDDRGSLAAVTRTGLDFVITVPRYHLERIVNERNSHTALSITIALIAAGGVAVTFVGALPGLALLAVAGIFAIAQRSHLARSLRVSHPSPRRRRFLMAALCAGVFVACYLAFLATISEASWTAKHTVFYVVGTAAMFAAPAFLIAALLTYLPQSRGPKVPAVQPEQ